MLDRGGGSGAGEPFLFFCDFHEELAEAVRTGRRREFAGFARFADPKAREAIPDPNALETCTRSSLSWPEGEPARLAEVRRLLALRRSRIVPYLRGTVSNGPPARRSEEHTSELQSLMRISYAVFCLKKTTQ